LRPPRSATPRDCNLPLRRRRRLGLSRPTLESVVESATITTCASITAKPFFEGRGFRVVKRQEVERQGIRLVNFVMVKRLR
ncbi:MAG: GNAT family N-acetyltransferase, partial [Thermoguttaceae bacterium]|nr:GNAT family N-acetyltransferase [Thermoguttaceae bacterium]